MSESTRLGTLLRLTLVVSLILSFTGAGVAAPATDTGELDAQPTLSESLTQVTPSAATEQVANPEAICIKISKGKIVIVTC
ncbi:hypothetical protein [Halobaculum sp. MBLA0143]|uniref:hypothetical protein n=1 Tax=Halobaculum sp. MBLA0143 TaxID=3079933 RepID=UPI00352321B6